MAGSGSPAGGAADAGSLMSARCRPTSSASVEASDCQTGRMPGGEPHRPKLGNCGGREHRHFWGESGDGEGMAGAWGGGRVGGGRVEGGRVEGLQALGRPGHGYGGAGPRRPVPQYGLGPVRTTRYWKARHGLGSILPAPTLPRCGASRRRRSRPLSRQGRRNLHLRRSGVCRRCLCCVVVNARAANPQRSIFSGSSPACPLPAPHVVPHPIHHV